MTNKPPQNQIPDHTPLTEAEAKTGENLLAMMGNVFATWQGIEHTVADIYLVFFSPSRSDASAVAFYAVRTFEARVSVVNALITFFCDDEQKKQWADLLALIRKRSMARNAVAHGLVARHGKPPKTEFVIGKSMYDIADFPDPPLKNGFYTVKELREMCTTFSRLTEESG